MGTFSRLRYVIAANVNALIEKAEDAEKLLRALLREMEDAGEEARLASAELLAEQQHLERLKAQLTHAAEQCHTRARKAVEEQRDDVARAGLKAHAEVMHRLAAVKQDLTCVDERIRQMELDMAKLKSKMAEARLKLKSSYSRKPGNKVNRASAHTTLSPSEKRVRQALGRFDRLQTQVENLEARVRSYEVGGAAPAAWDRKATVTDPQVEQELQRLKHQVSQGIEQNPTAAAA